MHNKIWSISPSFGHFIKSPVVYLEKNGFSVELLRDNEKVTIDSATEKIKGCAALIPGTFPITEALLNTSNNLKIIAMAGTGVDHIDLSAATRKGIVVTNVPATNNKAVAELAMGFIFTLARNIVQADRDVKRGKWPRVTGRQVGGKTLGIVGMGQIGLELAKLAISLGMKVLAYDAYPNAEVALKVGFVFCELKTLMIESDFVSVHVPLTNGTKNLIDEKSLHLMKPTAYLLNLSRGGVVNEMALFNVLSENLLAGAALDVFVDEPPKNSQLLGLSNVITTPHMGGYTYEALEEIGMSCARGIVDLFNGKKPANVVNDEVFEKLFQ